MSFSRRERCFCPKAVVLCLIAGWLAVGSSAEDACQGAIVNSADPSADLKPIGGRWYVREGDTPVYFYKDGERFVDLFSYHTKDFEQVLTAVRPGTAERGKTHAIQFQLTPGNSRRRLPNDTPSWVQIGPFEATKISRDGNVVTAEFEIPADAAVGILLDCHLEFGTGGNPFVIKRNQAFRVVE